MVPLHINATIIIYHQLMNNMMMSCTQIKIDKYDIYG